MELEYLGYFLSILIGISLSLVGSGGSILCIPILVYLFKIPPELATSYSLFIVGISSFFGSCKNCKSGNINFKTALLFGIPSIITLLIVRKFVYPIVPNTIGSINGILVSKNTLIMFILAILMMLSSLSMLYKEEQKEIEAQKPNFVLLIIGGIFIGILTGFLGAGGGFLIIPALMYFANLKMTEAVGTSLFIILLNSIIGFTGDFLNGITLDYTLLISITIISILGMFVGFFLSKKIDGKSLKPAFGWFLMVFSFYIIIKELFF